MAEKKKSRLAWMKHFVSPTAIGMYTSIAFAVLAFMYYQARQNPNNLVGVFKVLHDIDQKSIDYRLLLRGQRAPDSQVAVLAVDDRSIDQVGRWPWPRDVLAKAMKAALDGGAKVIATDIVWSEPTDRPEVRFVGELGQKIALNEKLTSDINHILESSDSDKIFAEFVKAYQSKIVLGNFFEAAQRSHENIVPIRATPCIDIAFKDSLLNQMVDSQERPFVVLDDREINLDPKLVEAYATQVMPLIEASIKDSRPTPTNAAEARAIQDEVLHAKLGFCVDSFFKTSGEKPDETAQNLSANWQALAGELFGGKPPASSFDEWVTLLDENTLRNAIPETLEWTLNIPAISLNATNHGYFNASLDTDGTIRRSQLVTRTGSRYVPSIALLAYLTAKNYSAEIEIGALPKNPGTRGIQKFKLNNSEGEPIGEVPADQEGYLMINYAGRGRTIPHASIADLLNEGKKTIQVTQMKKQAGGKWSQTVSEVPKSEFLKDKVFVLGVTAIAVFDLRVSPFDENFPGVETHANTIDNLIRGDFLFHNAEEDLMMPVAMLGVGAVLATAIAHSGALLGLVLTLLVFIAVALIDRFFLFSHGTVVSIAFPLVQTGFTYMGLTFYKYLTEERKKKELRQTFSKYVSPQIVEEVLRDPKNLELGGRKEKITVFFSDVRGFTTISEKLDPRALSDLLNSYLTPMTDLVFANKGTLDKYMGDAIMAFFGAPITTADHAKWAARCALQHLEKLELLRIDYRSKGLPDIDIGIGLNTGECSVGNMGSQTVRNYTVMGDTVNLASRLEGINKEYGTRIVISEFTFHEIKESFTCREIDWVRVKGKNQPVKIFELVCEGNPAKEKQLSLEFFNAGYLKYHKADFSNAIVDFKKAVEIFEQDETSKVYIERCEDLIAEPPPADWDGVYVMKTK